jgi:hypothetical protein
MNFIAIFVFISCYVEINLGTALRHRAVVIVPIAFLIASSVKQKVIEVDTTRRLS